MSLNRLVKVVVTLWCLVMIAGCKPQDQQGSAPAPQEQVKTEAEYKAEAEKEVTAENMEQELDSIEKEVNAEDAQTP
jgi:hypothetical protein